MRKYAVLERRREISVTGSQQPRHEPTVFISYAHESDALRASVKALAEWLGQRDCNVLTDHPYVDRPPSEGWQTWMHNRIAEADTVLVVCTPKLRDRFEKTARRTPGVGPPMKAPSSRSISTTRRCVTTSSFPSCPRAVARATYPLLYDPGGTGTVSLAATRAFAAWSSMKRPLLAHR